MRRHLWLLIPAAMAACSDGTLPLATGVSPDARVSPPGAEAAVPSFVVVVAPKADPGTVARDHGIVPTYTYSQVLTGFAGRISDLARQGLLRDTRVVEIRKDQPFAADATEPAASWGLDRVDQRRGMDGSYTYAATGKGVAAYIVDTGIRYSHRDFGGRASFGFDAFGADGNDCYGHGTHVAGTVGGAVYGVAKEVGLVSVRVLGCDGGGSSSTVLAGLDWVLQNAKRPAVVNMSLGGGSDTLVDNAVRRLYAAGISVAVSAGNYNLSACFFTPARVAEAMTVGATTKADERAAYSDFGDCVDWFAPGDSITSDSYRGDDAIAIMSGTSMAAPHTTGAAALYLESHPQATPDQVAAALAAATSKNIIRSASTRHNDLLYTLGDWGTVNPNLPPTASFTATCAALSCGFSDGSTDQDGTVAAWQWEFGDGTISGVQSPFHAFAASGSYTVTLTVTDNLGATAMTAHAVAVADSSAPNTPPTAAFTFSCARLSCDFQDGSSDPDGSVAQLRWDFGDGAGTMAVAASSSSHTFAAGDSYAVSLTAIDNAGAAQTVVRQVAVGIQVSLTVRRQKGRRAIDVSWQGAESSQVDVFVNDARVATLAEAAGVYTYAVDGKGQGSYSVRVCEATTTYCSQSKIVTM